MSTPRNNLNWIFEHRTTRYKSSPEVEAFSRARKRSDRVRDLMKMRKQMKEVWE